MNRTEIEVQLNRDRAWLIETFAALPLAEVTRPATPSEHDAATQWSAKDHLVHLACIERNFNAMIRRHLAGDQHPVGLVTGAGGARRPIEQVMAEVHAMNERAVAEHREQTLSAAIAFGQQVRAETLALLAELSDAQLLEKLPGAPWADGTIGGVLAVNAGHGRQHWQWVKAGWSRYIGS